VKYPINASLPKSIKLPLHFREQGQQIEGRVSHPIEIMEQFEPQDVLNGAMELIDANGTLVIILTEDAMNIAEK
jgi:hypothetical protein